MEWRTETRTVVVQLTLTDREANDLYTDIYQIQRERPGARSAYPLIFALYDTLDKAGVDGTR